MLLTYQWVERGSPIVELIIGDHLTYYPMDEKVVLTFDRR